MPKEDPTDGDQPHGAVVDGAFLIAGGQAPELLAAIDQPLDTVARAVQGTIKRAASALGALTRDGDTHAPLAQIAADALGAVALVADHPPRATPRPSPSWPADRAFLQQRLDHGPYLGGLTGGLVYPRRMLMSAHKGGIHQVCIPVQASLSVGLDLK